MTKLRLSISATLAVVGGAICLVIQQQLQLREENGSLRQQVEQLAPLQAENQHLSNLLVQANNDQKRANAQLKELLSLRGEVENLRRQTNELAELQSENQRLRSPQLTSKAGTQTAPKRQSWPKESWAFASYADPESAFQSTVWAMSQGDAKMFRASVAPEGEEFTKWLDEPDVDLSARIKGEMENVTAFQILDKDAISDDAAILTVMAVGIDEVGRFKLQRIGDDWKLAGPVQEAGPPNTK